MSTSEDKPEEQVEETITDLDVTDEEAAEQVRGGLRVKAIERDPAVAGQFAPTTNPPPLPQQSRRRTAIRNLATALGTLTRD